LGRIFFSSWGFLAPAARSKPCCLLCLRQGASRLPFPATLCLDHAGHEQDRNQRGTVVGAWQEVSCPNHRSFLNGCGACLRRNSVFRGEKIWHTASLRLTRYACLLRLGPMGYRGRAPLPRGTFRVSALRQHYICSLSLPGQFLRSRNARLFRPLDRIGVASLPFCSVQGSNGHWPH
jgi:hypothetical protein